jgi:hypothetical protein
MDDLLALGPAVLIPLLALAWLGAAATAGVTVGRAVHLADLRSAPPSRDRRGSARAAADRRG